MNKIELLGFLRQDLRDDREPDEEDLSLALCRETSKIFEPFIEHGYLTHDMFDAARFIDPQLIDSDEDLYAVYKTTNYPVSYVVFANRFADWLSGKDERERLGIMDLICIIKEYSGLRIKILGQASGSLVVVRNRKHSGRSIKERAFIAA